MKTVNTHLAKTQLSKLLAEVETKHETIRICRNNRPIAVLKPIDSDQKNALKQHAQLKKISINYDPVAPLSEDEWPEINTGIS